MDRKPILLCDDDPNDQFLIVRALEKNEIKNPILVAQNGSEALGLLYGDDDGNAKGSAVPAFVILDIKMPKVNGLEVLREIRNHENTRRLPVVMLTSSDEESDLIQSYDLGVNSYIRKPIDYNEFRRCVADIGAYWISLNRAP